MDDPDIDAEEDRTSHTWLWSLKNPTTRSSPRQDIRAINESTHLHHSTHLRTTKDVGRLKRKGLRKRPN
eukprot:scaffold12663_cov101-Isochrysis_galbana.AAC.2